MPGDAKFLFLGLAAIALLILLYVVLLARRGSDTKQPPSGRRHD
jgi:hypothetical protein